MSTIVAPNLSRAICLNHPLREAAAKCVGCGRAYCRECVTAHDRRMLCAGCYREKTERKAKPKRDWFILSVFAQFLLGFIGLWLTAYFVGRVLLNVPTSFHEGSVWERLGSGE
jgi:hypothetical protein